MAGWEGTSIRSRSEIRRGPRMHRHQNMVLEHVGIGTGEGGVLSLAARRLRRPSVRPTRHVNAILRRLGCAPYEPRLARTRGLSLWLMSDGLSGGVGGGKEEEVAVCS